MTHSSGVKLNTVGQLVIAEASDAFTSLGVPQFDMSVIPGTDKVGTIVVEADVFNCLCVSYRHMYGGH